MRASLLARWLGLVAGVAVLSGPGTVGVLGSPVRDDVSLTQGWSHLPLAATGFTPGTNGPFVPVQLVAGGTRLELFQMPMGKVAASRLWSSATGQVWRQVPLVRPAFQRGDLPRQLASAGRFLILTGVHGYCPNAQCQPVETAAVPDQVIWVSQDGTRWRRGAAPPGVQLGPFVRGGAGVIAFGAPNVVGGPISGPSGITVWTSADGLGWRQLNGAGRAFAAPFSSVAAVQPGGPGLIAAGIVRKSPRHPALRVAIWVSRDGLSWSQVPNTRYVFGKFGDHQSAGEVRLVSGARGSLIFADSGTGARFWSSQDGIHWRRAENVVFSFQDMFAGRIAAWADGFVGLSDQGGETVVWVSHDGLAWRRVGSDELFGGSVEVSSLTPFRGGLAAAGDFAAHPAAACLRKRPTADLRRFRPAMVLWSPSSKGPASSPRIDLTDPRALKLRPADLPIGLQPPYSEPTYQGMYTNLCAGDPALGKHRAYVLSFAAGLHGEALSIVTRSVQAARAGFAQASRLVYSSDPLEQVVARQELPATLHIGQATRVFAVTVKAQLCDEEMAVLRPHQCTISMYQASAVVWREGRVVGEVVSAPLNRPFQRPCKRSQPPPDMCTPGGGQYLAIRLAQRQLAHLLHPTH